MRCPSCGFENALQEKFCGKCGTALKRSEEALALAQDLSDPYSIAHALWCTAWLHQSRREARAAQERAEATMALATEYGFAGELGGATIHRGWALAEQGDVEEGIAQIHQGLATGRAIGVKVFFPGWLTALAEAYGKLGQTEEGLRVLEEAHTTVDSTGERLHEAEIYRAKGELTLQPSVGSPTSKSAQAQEHFLNAIGIAR
jgi:tetratricopeptide (TPR) repeat protein